MKTNRPNGRPAKITRVIWRQERVVRKSAWISIRATERAIWLPDFKKSY